MTGSAEILHVRANDLRKTLMDHLDADDGLTCDSNISTITLSGIKEGRHFLFNVPYNVPIFIVSN